MRISPRLTFCSALLIALSACGGGGNSSTGNSGAAGSGSGRQAMLDREIEGCVSSAQQAGPVPAGVDLRAVCSCAIDRVTAGKSDDEARTMFSRAPNEAEIAMTRNCMMEGMRAATKS